MHAKSHRYGEDLYAWIQTQASLLRQGRFQDMDRELLAEELEAMGRRERNELVSRLVILIAHLFKRQHQPEHRSSSWRGSVVERRVQVKREMQLNPSLKTVLAEAVEDAYPDAVHIASKQTGIQTMHFPGSCPYQHEQLLDEDFWPG